MPRRDGQPTEQELVRQRAGQAPDPQRGGQLPPQEAALAALQATRAAAQTVATASPVIAPTLTVAAINAAAAGILGSFDRFLDARRRDQSDYVSHLLEAEVPDLPADTRFEVVDQELERERQFAAKARQRLDRDLPKALMIPDPAVREAQVQKILDRERRYAEMREQAMAVRTLGTAEQRRVEALSPQGGYWHLSPHVREHTLDCLAMGGKVWPHSVLRTYHPPLHGGCPCEILTIQEAEQAGLLQHTGQLATPDEALQAMQISEAEFDDEEFAEELTILEAFYDNRWGAGTTKGGQFRPKRGGDPGSVLRHPHLLRMPHISAVSRIDRQAEVRDLKVKDLREGDQVMVNGNLEHVTKVHGSTPGLVDLEHTGTALIDREHIRGIPGEGHPPEGDTGLPELPKYGPQDRFELRHGDNGSLVMWDREKNKPHAVWDHGWDLNAVKQGVAEDNAAHRAQLARHTPPPNPMPGSVTHEQVAGVAKMRKPAEGGQLIPGVHYNPDLQRSHAEGDTLHLPPGYFKLGRQQREAVLHRHFGRQLADSLGKDGVAKLVSQDEHLHSRKNVVEAYHALNSDAMRSRFIDLHPEAARLVAQAAHERGVPLHPEAAKLVRAESTGDVAPSEHPAHKLAERLPGMTDAESGSMLREAGYDWGGSQHNADRSEVTHLFHNHDQGATIAVTIPMAGHGVDVATAARADIAQPVPDAERRAIRDAGAQGVIEHMKDQGFSPGYTSSGRWLQFVHPDGRGRAVKLEATPNGDQVTKVAAFTPDDESVTDARTTVIRTNPLQAIKPGDSFESVRNALESGLGWLISASQGRDEAPHLPEGITGYAEFANNSEPSTHRIVVHYTRGEDGGFQVAAVGHGTLDESKRGRIVSAAEHEVEVNGVKAERERQRQERERKIQGRADEIKQAVAAGDGERLQKALETYGDVTEAVRGLRREHGFAVLGHRRSSRGGHRQITYTLHGPVGEQLKVTGGYGFRSGGITKVQAVGNPQGGKRTRLPQGQAPKNLDELLVDALGRADELGKRYDAAVHVTGVIQGDVARGAQAHHEPTTGVIAIRKQDAKQMKEYLAKRAEGEPLSESDHMRYYDNLQALQHEINHGVGKAGDSYGGLAFGGYRQGSPRQIIEEALTEENAHPLVTDWLRSHGMTDVLQAVKKNQQSYQVKGVYQKERTYLKRILDDAGIPESERRGLLERMKFQMTPAEQDAQVMHMAGSDNVLSALNGQGRTDYARHAAMQRNFQPILHSDLSDVPDKADVTLPSGRTIDIGAGVTAPTEGTPDGAKAHGEVTGFVHGDGYTMVRVRTDDGSEMLYPLAALGGYG